MGLKLTKHVQGLTGQNILRYRPTTIILLKEIDST